ncbi:MULTISPECIES: enoyl-CoA hydratase/isomerase family protein [unclassified Rhizobium]|uniref:enoyl-CoA hydratase/isomerase family protein n=1 Tax=unclassified Rhizobium TaxID=2613769 RepID=UPI000EA936EE|nr:MULTISPECIES: enoyl-CoA hydratase/isomerase family protein [unclassified Rhizobium]AYG65171.1 enoyl-CoA hydratase/isomerase family protein [Rhizobium sp. CCGE531]AYG71655.1 enoyl-CoA hydratase/isomerase family protein [Rhizobium sp. CCGE532]
MDSTDEVIIERRGSAGIIRLNRPKALNSLTLPMVRVIASALEDFAADPSLASVIVVGEGERGFCAGGDIRLLHQSGKEGSDGAETFWREEFRLNHAISRYPKPYVVLMDGITMGGGVGLSAHGSHRVVTERTRLAMPETGIGYFPDVGATWLLPRAPGEAGTWMGLAGLVIGAADAIHARFADHCLPSSDLPVLVDAVASLPLSVSAADVHALIKTMAVEAGGSRLAANRDVIDRAFASDTVEGILQALASEPSEFATEAAGVIASRSPTSLKLTLRLLRAGRASADLAECLDRELGACMGILYNHDFYEGVRAAVIDKDRNPKWSPATLAEVTPGDIDRFFVPAQPPLFSN